MVVPTSLACWETSEQKGAAEVVKSSGLGAVDWEQWTGSSGLGAVGWELWAESSGLGTVGWE